MLIQGKGRARDDVKYVSIDSRSLDTAAKLFAVTDLILSNNSGEGIRGFVLGSALDLAGKYNYAGYINMAEYSELITADCAVLSQVMQKNGLELEIVLPISDHSFGKMTVAKTHDEYTSYRSDLLLKSIYSCSSLYGLDLSKYYVMLESFNSPVASEENGGYYVVENDDIISANDCGALSDLMDDLCYEFGVDNRQFLFNFRPSADIDAENFKVAYTYNYNILASTDDVRSYIISFLDSADEKSMTNALRTQFNYVDTEKNAEVSADALALLGVESWKELYDKYDKNDCVRTKLRSEPLSKKSDGRVEGSYPIWDFEDSGSTEEWAEFIGCQSLSVYSVAQGRSRSLVAQMSKDSSAAAGALYESIIYHSENAIVFENIDSLSFDVFIPLKNNDRVKYEIELTLIEDGKRSEYKGEILSGETVTFYADISDAQNVKQIILGSRCLDEENNGAYFVCINGITMNSNSLSDEELERIVLSGKLGTMIDENISYFFDEVILVALIISISAVATIIVWGVHAIKRKKYNKKLKKY